MVQMKLKDLIVQNVRSSLVTPTGKLPFTLACGNIEPKYVSPKNGRALFTVKYELSATDSLGRSIWNMSCKLVLIFEYEGEAPSNSDLKAYNPEVLRLAHPYLTELVQTLTQKMGLPSLVLDIFRVPNAK